MKNTPGWLRSRVGIQVVVLGLFAATVAMDQRPMAAAPSPADVKGAGGPGARVYRSADELRAACREFFEERHNNGNPMPVDEDSQRVWVVAYLDSPDPAIRDAAADIVARAPRPIRASALVKYLSDKYPLNVRMAALARTLYGFMTDAELRPGADAGPNFEKSMEKTWAKMLNELVAGPTTPPYLVRVVEAPIVCRDLRGTFGPPYLLKPENRQIVIRRVLYMLHDLPEASQRDLMDIRSNGPLRPEAVAEELVRWYPLEPDARTRRLVLEEVVGPAVVSRQKGMEPVLAIAVQDLDKENARVARAIQGKLAP